MGAADVCEAACERFVTVTVWPAFLNFQGISSGPPRAAFFMRAKCLILLCIHWVVAPVGPPDFSVRPGEVWEKPSAAEPSHSSPALR